MSIDFVQKYRTHCIKSCYILNVFTNPKFHSKGTAPVNVVIRREFPCDIICSRWKIIDFPFLKSVRLEVILTKVCPGISLMVKYVIICHIFSLHWHFAFLCLMSVVVVIIYVVFRYIYIYKVTSNSMCIIWCATRNTARPVKIPLNFLQIQYFLPVLMPFLPPWT